mgnify:CR=1 FL=1
MRRKKLPSKKKQGQKQTNAVSNVYGGIKFASKLETYCYKELEKLKIPFAYEKTSFEVFASFTDKFNFYTSRKNSDLAARTGNISNVVYTPDFEDDFPEDFNYGFIIEIKGVKTRDYMQRLKLFRWWRNKTNFNKDFFECRTQKDVKSALDIIKLKVAETLLIYLNDSNEELDITNSSPLLKLYNKETIIQWINHFNDVFEMEEQGSKVSILSVDKSTTFLNLINKFIYNDR